MQCGRNGTTEKSGKYVSKIVERIIVALAVALAVALVTALVEVLRRDFNIFISFLNPFISFLNTEVLFPLWLFLAALIGTITMIVCIVLIKSRLKTCKESLKESLAAIRAHTCQLVRLEVTWDRPQDPTVPPGTVRLCLRYGVISQLDCNLPIWLGAHLERNLATGLNNTDEDVVVTLSPGDNVYIRNLTVPCPPGSYTLHAEIWYGQRSKLELSLLLAELEHPNLHIL